MRLKILMILFLIGISFVNVKAYTYSEWSTEFPEGYEDIMIESEVRYKWYKETEIDVEYLSRDNFGDRLYDLNDYKYTESSEETIDKPETAEDRIIIEEVKEHLFTEKDVDHILIKDMVFQSPCYFSEIDIFDKLTGIPVNYTFENTDTGDIDVNLFNDDDKATYLIMENSAKIIINLGRKYDANDLTIKLYIKAEGTGYKKIVSVFNYGMDYELMNKLTTIGICTAGCIIDLSFNSTYTKTLSQMVKHYTYKDKLYKTYNITKEYMEGYFKEMEGYIKDENSETVFYKYITDPYILTDLYGNLIDRDTFYCDKNPCIMKLVKKKRNYPLQSLRLLIQRHQTALTNIF